MPTKGNRQRYQLPVDRLRRGIKQIEAKGDTGLRRLDMTIKVEQLEKEWLIQWPRVRGAMVPVVNLEGVKPGEMVFDWRHVANIDLGKTPRGDDRR